MNTQEARTEAEAATPKSRTYQPTREIRFAAVLYGGVSLAIYINGVAQELLRLVLATAPQEASDQTPDQALLPAQALQSSMRVYRKLGQMRSSELTRAAFLCESDPIRRRFVVDILSGTSAGGINAMFLAKALANQPAQDSSEPLQALKSFKRLTQLWVSQGDVNLLINDSLSNQDWQGQKAQGVPQSLLNSRRMYAKLLEAFNHTEASPAPGAAGHSVLVDELDLFITATDIHGLVLPLRLSNEAVCERRYKNVFHFRYATPACTGYDCNDLTADNNPFLAYAARCTSSFPGAFEPMTLGDIAQFPPYQHNPERFARDCERWRRFFKDYLHVPEASQEQLVREFQARPFGDGGYLDNKPFTYATEALKRRRANVVVERKLLYVEPAPEHPEQEATPEGKPDVLQNIQAALLTLPRVQTIRDDLDRLSERNRQLNRVDQLLSLLERDVEHCQKNAAAQGLPVQARPRPKPGLEWMQEGLAKMLRERGPAYGAYHRLKLEVLTDELAELFARLANLAENSTQSVAIGYLVRAWRDDHYVEDPQPDCPTKPTQNQFLLDFDLGYRLRRLEFVQHKLDQMYEHLQEPQLEALLRPAGIPSAPLVRNAQAVEQARQELLRIKGKLSHEFVRLRETGHALRAGEVDPAWRTLEADPALRALEAVSQLRECVAGLHLKPGLLKDLLFQPTEAARLAMAQALVRAPDYASQFEEVATVLGQILRPMFTTTAARCEQLLLSGEPHPPSAFRLALWHYYQFYEDYDLVRFPLLAGTGGEETSPVDVTRISPDDATLLVNQQTDGCTKLAGTSFGHFGAFLDPLWRQSDILWGRLDAAERIIRTVLPANHPDRDTLILEASVAILEEELASCPPEEARRIVLEAFRRTKDGQPRREVLEKFLATISKVPWSPKLKGKLDSEALLRDYPRAFQDVEHPPRKLLLGSLARGTRVVGQMLDGLAEQRQVAGRRVATTLALLGSVMWGIVEVSVPHRLPRLVFQYWLRLLYLLEGLLFFGGWLSGSKPVQQFGLIALGVTLVVDIGPRLLAIWMSGGKLSRRLLAVGCAGLCGLVALGIIKGLELLDSAHGGFGAWLHHWLKF